MPTTSMDEFSAATTTTVATQRQYTDAVPGTYAREAAQHLDECVAAGPCAPWCRRQPTAIRCQCWLMSPVSVCWVMPARSDVESWLTPITLPLRTHTSLT